MDILLTNGFLIIYNMKEKQNRAYKLRTKQMILPVKQQLESFIEIKQYDKTIIYNYGDKFIYDDITYIVTKEVSKTYCYACDRHKLDCTGIRCSEGDYILKEI